MAKKLYVGTYRFDASEKNVYIKGNINVERFLIITNVTDNIIIYNFANSSLGYTASSYNPSTDETLLALVYDTTSMSDSDALQVFIDNDYQEITPAEDLLDPVGKLRVSNPANLIDTDFEYGLQSTKWETLQTVNNLPTIFTSSGDVSIEGIESISLIAGSKSARVVTSIAHNLVIGNPISVLGTSQYQAEGQFVVTSVASNFEFYYQMDVEASATENVSASYTSIIPGKFHEGSSLVLSNDEGIVTNGADPSVLTATTQNTHGFSQGTKVYLRNTIGPKVLGITTSEATAPDGKPFIDTSPTSASNFSVDQTASTGRGGFRDKAVITYDWEGTYQRYLVPADINTTSNVITWSGHNLHNKARLLFQTAYEGRTDGGLNDGQIYFTEVINANSIKLHTSQVLNSGSEVNLTTMSNSVGLSRLVLAYKVEGADGTLRRTEYGQHDYFANLTGDTTPRGSNQTSTQTYDFNLTTRYGGNGNIPANLIISQITMSGDLDSTSEFCTVTIAGTTEQVHTNSQTRDSFNVIRHRSTNAQSVFTNFNANAGKVTIGSEIFLRVQISCSGTVGTFANSNGDRYRFILGLPAGAPPVSSGSTSHMSGIDLLSNTYGLGNVQPNAVIAFQGITTTSTNTTSAETYSFLANQRFYGRYGTYAARNTSTTLTIAGDNVNTGNFVINNSQTSVGLGTTSEVFYVMANSLTSDRNTFYKTNHGLTGSSVDCTISVGQTAYDAGERFNFSALSGSSTEMPQSFDATLNILTSNVVRITTKLSPETDDITRVPSDFTVGILGPNPTFNTIYVQNHKVNASVDATYNNISGIGIGATPNISDGDTITLQRADDNRLKIFAGNPVGVTTTTVTQASNNNTQTLFLDLETAVGFEPLSGSITRVEFRGDFSGNNEFVDLTFSDGDVYRIGQFDDQGDTAVYTTSTTLLSKDISNLLQVQGGKKGISVTFDPSSPVSFGPGGGPWWGIRFTYNLTQTGFALTSPGTGSKSFSINALLGAFDGVYSMNSIPSTKQFLLNADFQIPPRVYSFGPADINNATEVITPAAFDHNLVPGEKVSYDPGINTSILPAGFGSGVQDVYVIGIGSTTIKLASSELDANNNNAIDLTSTSGIHTITANNLIKNIKGTGDVSIVDGSKIVTGNGTRFLTDFKRFDSIFIDNGNFVEKFVIDSITTDTNMELFEIATATASSKTYYYSTQLALRPDGFSLHKSFDGGVDITAGTSPNSRICRQTRKYFRYQSGKGIQTSFAINFNPPKIVSKLLIATGSTATVTTQEQHNLAVNDTVIISNATVSTGVNYYNGTFTVASVADAFTFTYVMLGSPTDVTAGGFPTYVRQSWTDSSVRAGMFDDQNGFFYEFDGQYLYAVRRSSTTQASGDVSVTRNSPIVTGEFTAFTSQINTGQNVVIRGQTYKVVEVSSDSKLIIQPPYRGISATSVKMTITVDTKTRQSEWNLDPADGTGFTGYILDLTKIQMAYIDYSWYGAGKIRYGFKDRVGHIRYFHEYRHNNVLDESYFRSGNLPARYEIENGPLATTAPTLFHFGTSIIMDGKFDDDKAYQITGESRPHVYTNGGSSAYNSNADSTFQQVTLGGKRVYVYAIQVALSSAQATDVGVTFKETSGTTLPVGTYVSQVKFAGSSSLVYLNYPATSSDPTGGAEYSVITSGTSFTIGETTAIELTRPIPLISVRLAPSVDSSLTGPVGAREIINRMQLQLQQASVTTNSAIELFLVQNTLPSQIPYEDADRPSLSEIIKHRAGDTMQGGTTIFSTKVASGSIAVPLTDLLEIGNSILGGDGIYPSGPDLLTLAVQPQSSKAFTLASPFTVSGKISWSESQA